MEKKYLFFDIDGTLTNRATGGIVPSAKEALQRLEENGHFVAIATGRAHYKAEKFTKANGFKNMVCNGGNGLVIRTHIFFNIVNPEKSASFHISTDRCCLSEARRRVLGLLLAAQAHHAGTS